MRAVLAGLALLLLAAPVAAAVEEPAPIVAPIGTVVVVFTVSDGMTYLPVGSAIIPPGEFCLTP
jgi:hypothetical protein